MTVKSPIFEPFLLWSENAVDVPITNSLRIQILPTIEDLFRARRHQYAAFIASEDMLVVWDDDATKLFNRAKSIEDDLLRFVSQADLNPEEKNPFNKQAPAVEVSQVDEELGINPMTNQDRPVVYFDAFLVGCSACLLMVLLGLGYAEIVQEVLVLKSYISAALLIMTPVDIFLSLVSSTTSKECIG